MTEDTRKIEAACLPADPGVTALLAAAAPILDRVEGLVGVEVTFVHEDDMRTPLAGIVCAVRAQLEDGPGIYMTQWAEHLDRHLPAAEIFRLQQLILGSVPAAVALERVGVTCPNDYTRKSAFRVFLTRDALFVSASDTTRFLMTLPQELEDWHRQMVLSVLPRKAHSNHDRLGLMASLEHSCAIWADAYTDLLGRFIRSYKVDIRPPRIEDFEAALTG